MYTTAAAADAAADAVIDFWFNFITTNIII